MAGAQIQAHSTGGRSIDRALINRWGCVKGQIEGELVEVVQQVCMQVKMPTS